MNNQKKFLLSTLTVVLALSLTLGISAFKSAEKTISPISMYYHGPSFSQADVQNKSYWNSTSRECPEGDERACQVTIDASLVQSGSFVSTVTLEAETGADAALIDVKNNGSSVAPEISNRD